MKYQTVDLPNGMNLHVWGPIGVRHNDFVSLHDSNINNQLVQLQLGKDLQWVIYGDSAYIHVPDSHILARHHNELNTDRQNLENKSLSSCRECIEWDYGDVGAMSIPCPYAGVMSTRIPASKLGTSGRMRRLRVGEEAVPTRVLVWTVWALSS